MFLNKIKSGIGLLSKLLYILTSRQKKLLVLVLLMMVTNGIFQTFGIAVIVPLVTAMTNQNQLMHSRWAEFAENVFGINSFTGMFVFICIGTALLYIFKNVFGVIQNWISARYSNKVNRELSTMVLSVYMNRDYDFFLNYGSSKVMRDVGNDPGSVNTILMAVFNIGTEALTIGMILAYIVVSDAQMALFMLLIALLCLWFIYRFFKRRMQECGRIYREASAETNKILLQAVQGIKEVQVMRKQNFFIKRYAECYAKQQDPGLVQTVATTAPTYVVEGFFVSGIMIFLAGKMLFSPDYLSTLPVLASFMMGAVRMLPSIGRISSNLNTITYNIPFLESAYQNVKKLKEEFKISDGAAIGMNLSEEMGDASYASISFDNELVIKDVSWHYWNSERNILDHLTLSIRKGQSIGLIGQSGAGKSTLADIILGLHKPQSGKVLLDGRDIFSIPDVYSKVIGFVPQTVYLVDGTVRENIAFGVRNEKIDNKKVWECLDKAQLGEFIRQEDKGLDTPIGELGARFSGGQRQRLAIARALYRDPQILVLDEATSALDNETEAAVMDAIEHLYGTITMIIIAHRLTTVKQCDVIYEIKDGKAVERDKKQIYS
jgi:ABC-type multidrug transport system fused ATPase/permease subunit